MADVKARERTRSRRQVRRQARRPAQPARRYFASETRGGTTYRIDFWQGRAVCDCPGFASWNHCWHVKEVLNMNGEEDPGTAMVEATPTAVATLPVNAPRGLITRPELGIITAIANTVGGVRSMMPKWITTPGEATAIMLAGHELGLQPMAAVRHLYIVNGNVVASSQALASLVLANEPGADIVIVETDTTKATVELRRPNRQPLRIIYTIEDAKRAGLAEKGVWKAHPADMLRWRAISRVCRLGAGDLINAVRPLHYPAPVELDGEDIEPIEAEAIETPALPEAHEDAGAAEGPPDPREAFIEWCRDQGLDTMPKVCRYLGIPEEGGAEALENGWLEKARAGGLTDDESLNVARAGIESVLREARRGRDQKVTAPLRAALSAVNPLGQLEAAIEAERKHREAEADIPPAPDSEATGAEAPLPQH